MTAKLTSKTRSVQIVATSLHSPRLETELAQLRKSSLQIIEDNSFVVANKSSSLEKLKDKMWQRNSKSSTRNPFNNFWDLSYLETNGWRQRITFGQQVNGRNEVNAAATQLANVSVYDVLPQI